MEGNSKSGWSEFSDLNAAYLVELFERYRVSPQSVSPEARAFFDRWGSPPDRHPSRLSVPGAAVAFPDPVHISAAIALCTAIRMYGYRAARLDPLGGDPPGDVELLTETHGLREEDLERLPASLVGGAAAQGARDARVAVQRLRGIYQGSSGFEFEHVSSAEERNWLREAVEGGRYRPPRDPIDERRLLERLTQVEAFERFLHSSFPAQTRFSLEGLDMLVPMLDELVGAAAEAGTREVMLGMAHRGRLSVLAHLLGKPYEQIIAEFHGSLQRPNVSACGSSDLGWTGDVKYHLGARKAYRGGREVGMAVSLVPNPSQLEFVNPVVQGMARAARECRDRPGPARVDQLAARAVLVHGDAAFVGEGIVAETLNLSRLPGYHVGGTLHLIANNQLGFTTSPAAGRSTLFASDLAKGFEMPVIHVNADDPEVCIAAIRLADAYVERFRKDVVIDLIGYRRWGHNEGDEPTFTQPYMYHLVATHPPVRELWAKEMARRGLVTSEEAEALFREYTEKLSAARRASQKEVVVEVGDDSSAAGLEAGGTGGGLGHQGVATEIQTAIPAGTLAELNEQLLVLPPDFHLHPKLEPLYARRRAALLPSEGDEGTRRIDWSHGEALAFASLLAEGIPLRLTGQDTARGTFSQRHMTLHDVVTDAVHVPLQNLPSARASCDVWDSPLSEQATLGFEFGYNVAAPEALVLWEAQYGDFVNAAQVVLDAFVASARSKWAELPSLVLLLPHGYEGQGPDHSSARLERFLQLAAEDNLRVANCTTAAQYVHLLRRQARLLSLDPRPLVLLTPKSLLRHPLVASPPEGLTEGRFQPVIDDSEVQKEPQAVRRLILCSGKVYFDLLAARQPAESEARAVSVAIVRVEELYPFPAPEIGQIVAGYPSLEEVVWVQEEPRNMGAWSYAAPRLRDLLEGRLPLLYVGRTRRASPAEGSHGWHLREQKRLVDDALHHQAAATN